MSNSAQPSPRGNGLSRIWTLASATLTQLLRMKVLAFIGVFCVIAVAFGFAFPVQNAEQQLNLLKGGSFGALQLFSMVIAIVSTAILLPRDLEDRTLYTILSKPVPRHQYLLGKYIGVITLIGIGLVLMDAIFSGILYLRENMVMASEMASLKANHMDGPEEVAALQALVQTHGLTWSVHAGVLAVFLKASVIAAMALLISCFSSSTLYTIVISFFLVIIGHGQELAREFFFQPHLSVTGQKIAALVLSILVPDLGMFDITDNIIAGQSVPMEALGWLLGTAVMYVSAYLVVAHLLFVEKEL
jgi:hypothetical protein